MDIYAAINLVLFAFPSFLIGLVALIFYLRKRWPGMALIAVAFLVSALFGLLNWITTFVYLIGQSWTSYSIGLYYSIVGLTSTIVFTILLLLGLYFLHKEWT